MPRFVSGCRKCAALGTVSESPWPGFTPAPNHRRKASPPKRSAVNPRNTPLRLPHHAIGAQTQWRAHRASILRGSEDIASYCLSYTTTLCTACPCASLPRNVDVRVLPSAETLEVTFITTLSPFFI